MATLLETPKTDHTIAARDGTTMKAIVQEGSGSADVLHLREVEKPVNEDGRVLVRVRAASVNALDWHTVHGGLLLTVIQKLMRSKEDPIRGADLSGVVESVGKDVTEFRPGDEVFGFGRGTFAEWSSAPRLGLVRKPKELSFTQAAAVGVAAITALQGVRDHGEIKLGQRVLIHGAGGGVGTYAVQIGKALGAHVTAVTGPKNVDIVAALGADVLIDYSKEDVTKRGDRYDAILDVAATRSVGSMRRLLKPNGIFVQCGAAKTGGWLGIFGRIMAIVVRSRLLKQRVLMYIAKTKQSDLRYLSELMVAGKVRPVIDRTYPLAETVEAVRYLGTGQARAKVVINVD
ncbi:MAG TPA: NAD(P)-dependent alcohol dehydrogenase [Candidatus Limnocylindria bacterium]|jgi:NADPH:quinone reductase-like Zn-dependent oxidoreductase